LADALEDLGAAASDVLAEAQAAVLAVADEFFEQGAALLEGRLRQVLPGAPRQVESDEDNGLGAAAVDGILEGLEVADAAGVEDDGLSGEDGVDAEAFAHGGGDVGEFGGPVEGVAAGDLDGVALSEDQKAVAVE